HDRRYAIDCDRIKKQLAWRAEEDFESGLELTVRWYLENPTWVERVSSGAYRRERLGLSG
ncbi:MAG: dTDP-glucose 4,6-dehydratase, partial [Planctomycetales bacterium]|nr:dTDP-glucose 4,6-dehydratase [Planctomycetales bacterium]NIO45350.1 dTDP-glucose 4,6-dehydratase [Planctomycetales bacterium]NIT32537.1 dTDP-glucose 4,6-dehydratase [Xanthomonadales bacterium]